MNGFQTTDPKKSKNKASYQNFEALSLYCYRCRMEVPLRKRLLLILPDGEKYEYLCARCGESLGSKLIKGDEEKRIILVR